MMTDFLLMNKIAQLIHDDRRQRLLYKKGITLKGKFYAQMSLSDITTASFLSEQHTVTPVEMRFSKVFGRDGAGDTTRDIIGIFTEFDTADGKFDLLFHNVELDECIRTPEAVMALIEAFSEREKDRVREDAVLWKLAGKNPEFLDFLLRYFSWRCTVKSFRGVEGKGFNGYYFINGKGEKRSVHFELIPESRHGEITRREAEFLAGYDCDAAMRDMKEAAERDSLPQFSLFAVLDGEYRRIMLGNIVLHELLEHDDALQDFSPIRVPNGIVLAEHPLDAFTAFAFSEGVRMRGGAYR